MLAFATLFALAGLISLSTAGYVLEDDYEPSSFFSMFDFFTGVDPTAGYVNYLDQETAQSQGLINTNGPVYMGVDSANVASGYGRSSVRVTSQKSYNQGLIIADIAHMPGGICGTWPAFWTVGPNWPAEGEIDIIEGVNSQSTNSMTLHTGDGCTITNNGLFTGELSTPNCDIAAPGQATNAGCQINTPNTNSFGTGFNDATGGVYATEWTSEAISIWFFPRSAIPADISSGNPDPTGWGPATASFAGGCDIDSHFQNQQIVFDTTFCGDWAGVVWSTDPVCSALASTCQDYVQNNPSDFADAFWSINSLKVFQSDGSTTPSSVSISASVGTALPTSIPVPIPTSFVTVFPLPSSGAPIPLTQSAPIPSSVPMQSFGGFTRGGNHNSFGNNGVVAVATSAGDETTTSFAVQATDVAVVSTSPSLAADRADLATSVSPAESEFPTSSPTTTSSIIVAASTQAVAATVITTPPTIPATSSTTSCAQPQYVTVSALQNFQFPSSGETQTAGVKLRDKRDLHRHLVRHQKKHAWDW